MLLFHIQLPLGAAEGNGVHPFCAAFSQQPGAFRQGAAGGHHIVHQQNRLSLKGFRPVQNQPLLQVLPALYGG